VAGALSASRRVLLVCMATGALGCAVARPPAAAPPRPFTYATDTFAFINESHWRYVTDPATGARVWSAQAVYFALHCAGVVRGARQFLVHARFDPTGAPVDDAAALRLARTTGLILQEEAYLGRVLDPAEGSWFLESLTSELAEDAWDELRRLEAAGGIIAAIESGDLSKPSFEVAMARKDVRLMIEEAQRGGVDLLVMPGVAAMLDAAIARGEGALDVAAAARVAR